MSKLRALLPVPVVVTPETGSPSLGRGAETPRRTRRSHRLIRPVRVMSDPVGDPPILTLQEPADVHISAFILRLVYNVHNNTNYNKSYTYYNSVTHKITVTMECIIIL